MPGLSVGLLRARGGAGGVGGVSGNQMSPLGSGVSPGQAAVVPTFASCANLQPLEVWSGAAGCDSGVSFGSGDPSQNISLNEVSAPRTLQII